MSDAALEVIRIYGSSPAIPPAQDPEVGVAVVTGLSAHLGVVDSPSPSGGANVPIPAVGSSRSILGTVAIRVVIPGSPVTTISNVKAFVSQADYNALAGAWSGMQLLTPGPGTDPADLDPFLASGGSTGDVDDYLQATRTLGPQGYTGDDMEDIYSTMDTPVDMLDEIGVGQIDLTGRGRADNTTATFGQSEQDCSRMLLMQIAASSAALRGMKPGVVVTIQYDESACCSPWGLSSGKPRTWRAGRSPENLCAVPLRIWTPSPSSPSGSAAVGSSSFPC